MASQSIGMNPAPAATPATHPSTGPRTPEGKARSAQNARKHGFSALTLEVLPAEQADFDTYQNELLDQIKPQAGLQADLFRQLIHAGWSLRRLERYELRILENGDPFDSPDAQAKLDRLERYRASHRRAYTRTLGEIRKLQTDAMLWFTVNETLDKCRDAQFPLANPASRGLNPRIATLSSELHIQEATRLPESDESSASCHFSKTNSPAASPAARPAPENAA